MQSLTHRFTQQTLTEHLLCARHCPVYLRIWGEKTKPLPSWSLCSQERLINKYCNLWWPKCKQNKGRMCGEKGPPEEVIYFSQNLNDDREQARQGLGGRTLQAEATEHSWKGPQCSTNKEQQEGSGAGMWWAMRKRDGRWEEGGRSQKTYALGKVYILCWKSGEECQDSLLHVLKLVKNLGEWAKVRVFGSQRVRLFASIPDDSQAFMSEFWITVRPPSHLPSWSLFSPQNCKMTYFNRSHFNKAFLTSLTRLKRYDLKPSHSV